jgi:hypothetical protein
MKHTLIQIVYFSFWTVTAIADDTLVDITNESGDSLLIHRLSDGEIWASFMLTDQIVDSFADHELIILQVDSYKPIKLEHQKTCGGAARSTQQVDYFVNATTNGAAWSLSPPNQNRADPLDFIGIDTDPFHHMRSDRRPEVVDFAIQGELAESTLWQQFKQGNSVIFHFTTSGGEPRKAEFDLQSIQHVIK